MIQVILVLIVSVVVLAGTVLCAGVCMCGLGIVCFRCAGGIAKRAKGICACIMMLMVLCVFAFGIMLIGYHVVRSTLGANGPRAHYIASPGPGLVRQQQDVNYSISVSIPSSFVMWDHGPAVYSPVFPFREIPPPSSEDDTMCSVQDEWTCHWRDNGTTRAYA